MFKETSQREPLDLGAPPLEKTVLKRVSARAVRREGVRPSAHAELKQSALANDARRQAQSARVKEAKQWVEGQRAAEQTKEVRQRWDAMFKSLDDKEAN